MATQTRAAWIFGSILLLFLFGIFIFAPPTLPDFKFKLIAFFCATLAGLFALFFSGSAVGKIKIPLPGKWAIQASAGCLLFLVVLFWWTRPSAPIRPDATPAKATGSLIAVAAANQTKVLVAPTKAEPSIPALTATPQTKDVSSGSVDFGCEQTLNAETPEIEVGPSARNIDAVAVWSQLDNAKSYNQAVVYLRDPANQHVIAVKATGTITGLDTQQLAFFKNCPGGGHGSLDLHAKWTEDR